MAKQENFFTEKLSNISDILKGESEQKKLHLVYREIRPNTALLKPIMLLPTSDLNLVSTAGQSLKQNAEELVFEILMLGKQTDLEFNLELKVGDRVLVGMDYLNPVKHNPQTRAETVDSINLWGYFAMQIAGIVAIVDYEKV